MHSVVLILYSYEQIGITIREKEFRVNSTKKYQKDIRVYSHTKAWNSPMDQSGRMSHPFASGRKVAKLPDTCWKNVSLYKRAKTTTEKLVEIRQAIRKSGWM